MQFADFSKDETKGVQTLIGALNLDRKVADKLSDVVADHELKSSSKPSKYTPYEVKIKEPSKTSSGPGTAAKIKIDSPSKIGSNNRSKAVWPYLLIGFLIVAVAGGWYFKDDIFNNRDEDQWNVAKASGSIEGYEHYQEKFPKGKHIRDAKDEILKIDESAWEIADSIDNVESYKTYKSKIPDGKYFVKAEETINELKADSINWVNARQENTKISYSEYLARTQTKLKYSELAMKAKDSINEAQFMAIDIPDFEEANRVKIDDEEISTNDTKEIIEEDKEPTEEELEKTAWEKAKDSNTFDAYIEFIKNDDKTGNYHNQAVNALTKKGKTGWLYVGRTNNSKTFSSDAVVSVVYRKNSSITNLTNDIPEVRDLIVLNGSLGRRTYSKSSPRDTQIGRWNVEKKAYVSTIKTEGQSAIIAQIIFN